MSDAQNYDSTNLETLRRDLEKLRAVARDSEGLKSPGDATSMAVVGPAARRPAVTPSGSHDDKDKLIARRLLAMLRRGEGDDSPTVSGTDFTETGVKRLLGQLTSPSKTPAAGQKILQRLHKFLTAPGPKGGEKVSGVSVEKIRRLSRLLEQTEKHGWEQVRARMAERRNGSSKAPATAIPARAKAAAPIKRKRPNRREAS